jgi:hypothetical protein
MKMIFIEAGIIINKKTEKEKRKRTDGNEKERGLHNGSIVAD